MSEDGMSERKPWQLCALLRDFADFDTTFLFQGVKPALPPPPQAQLG